MRGWPTICLVAGCLYSPRPLDGDDTVDAAPVDASRSPRITAGLIALWSMSDTGGTVTDSSGLAPFDLTIADLSRVIWADGALTIDAPVDINSGFGVPNRLIPDCKDTDQITVEAWVIPASTTQTGTVAGQPARVMTITVMNIASHQISLGQLGETWVGQVRTDAAGLDAHGGTPMLANGVVTQTLTHLVLTSSPTERRLWVDGVSVSDDKGGLLDQWENTRTFALGGDPNQRDSWLGTIALGAVYNRALDPMEVATNFAAGPSP
jgi:hypothetical protein